MIGSCNTWGKNDNSYLRMSMRECVISCKLGGITRDMRFVNVRIGVKRDLIARVAAMIVATRGID